MARRRIITSTLAVIGFILVLAVYEKQSLLSGANRLSTILQGTNQGQQIDGQSLPTLAPADSPLQNLARLLRPEDHIFRLPTTLYHRWEIKSGQRDPDGVAKQVFLINDDFPGPTIEARSGDTLVVEVYNLLETEESVAIHWHGLHMKGANHMDGVVGFTQCAIRPGNNFTYTFQVDEDQSGTFWYHAHSETHRADGLYGGLIVHKPVSAIQDINGGELIQYDYDDELLLLVGDWYHIPAAQALDKYMNARSNANEPVPDSLLINGHGRFICSMAMPAHPVECVDLEKPWLQLDKTKTYRFRVVNVGALAGITISIPGSSMTVVQLDGGQQIEEEDAVDSVGILYPAERMDIIVRWDDDGRKSETLLTISLDNENFRSPNLALVRTQSFLIASSPPSKPSLLADPISTTLSYFSLSNAVGVPLHPSEALPLDPNMTFVLYTTVVILTIHANIPMGIMNRTSWKAQAEPSLPLLLLDRPQWDSNQLVPWTGPEAVWVDVVLNNLDEHGHPFHLHGFDFYVLSVFRSDFSWGSYDPFTSTEPPGGPYNLVNPLRKDTVYVPRRGYAVLRFRADNEGLWMFHCHVLWHQASGMAMGFQVLGDSEGVFRDGNGEERQTAGNSCSETIA